MQNPDDVVIEQLPDDDNKILTGKLITIDDFASEVGQSYENIRKKVVKLKKLPEFAEHIVMQKNSLNRNVTYLDEFMVDYLKNTRRTEAIIVDGGEETIKELNLQIKLLKEDNERLKDENNTYIRKVQEIQEKLLNIKDNPELAIDTSKYILLEDHAKLEEKLEETEQKLEKANSDYQELKEKNEALEAKNKDFQQISIKVANLSGEVVEKSKLISEKEQDILSLRQEKLDIEEEKRKAEDDVRRIEGEKEKISFELEKAKSEAERELEEALSLGFFARRKRLKELKKKREAGE